MRTPTILRSIHARAWRVFYVRPRAEKKAAERLAADGFEVFVPLRAAVRQWSDRKQRVAEPLFRGYLFAHADERQRLGILEDPGIVKSLFFAGRLVEVTEEEITHLRALVTLPDAIEAVTMGAFPVGTDVLVQRGPLAGVRGRVTSHPSGLHLVVEIPSISHAVRLKVPADWVMRVAEAA